MDYRQSAAQFAAVQSTLPQSNSTKSKSRKSSLLDFVDFNNVEFDFVAIRPPVPAAIKDPTRSASSVAFNVFGSGGSTLHQISEQVRCYTSTA